MNALLVIFHYHLLLVYSYNLQDYLKEMGLIFFFELYLIERFLKVFQRSFRKIKLFIKKELCLILLYLNHIYQITYMDQINLDHENLIHVYMYPKIDEYFVNKETK